MQPDKLQLFQLFQKASANISFLIDSTVATAAFVQQVVFWLTWKVHSIFS